MPTMTGLLSSMFSDCQVPMTYVMVQQSLSDSRIAPDVNELLEFISSLEYNEFHGKKVAAYLRSLIEKGKIFTIRFGREYSPVIYIKYCRIDRNTEEVMTGARLEAFHCHMMKDFKKKLNPQDASIEGREVRFWFD